MKNKFIKSFLALIFCFSALPFVALAASITVTSPNGGETIQIGSNYTIKWSSQGLPSGEYLHIMLADANGNGLTYIKPWLPAYINEYVWTVADIYPSMVGGNYKIKIQTASGSVQDVSDGTFKVTAASPGVSNMSGWAWSSNIGWISFNCTNTDTCKNKGGIDYGVNKNADNTLTGYAWSPNIGWIQFGGFSTKDFPTGDGTQGVNVDINGNNPKGWIRAISQNGNGWDGWDGWISLSGANYKVRIDDGVHFTGHAWGDSVIGWMLFDVQSTGICSDCGVKIGAATPIASVDLDVRDSTGSTLIGRNNVAYNTTPTFVWTLNNLPAGTTCSVSKTSSGGTNFSQSNITSSGQIGGSPLVDSTYTYKISCNDSSSKNTTSFTVLPAPADFSISIDGGSITPIQFLNSGQADSVEKVFRIIPSNFSSPVTITIDSVNPAVSPPTVFSYCLSLTSCTPWTNNPSVTIQPSSGAIFRVRVSKKLPTTPTYDITIKGEGGGITKYAVFQLTPTIIDPKYEEI
ncbi:MAG: hypothetical protein AAB484_02450 [Patescibacteria group bacterium]